MYRRSWKRETKKKKHVNDRRKYNIIHAYSFSSNKDFDVPKRLKPFDFPH